MIKKIIKTLIGNASSILDEVITTDEERDAAKQRLEALLKTHEKEIFELEVEDRKSAREMYSDDASIQKIIFETLVALIKEFIGMV